MASRYTTFVTASVSEGAVRAALATVSDPEIHRDIVSLGMIRHLEIDGGIVRLRVALTTPACPLKDVIERDIHRAVGDVEGVTSVEVEWDKDVLGRQGGVGGRQEVPGVRNVIAVSAAKGGVGKTTIAVNLALSLAREGAKVGLLDADVYGPNVPLMMGIEDEPTVAPSGKMEPLRAHGVSVVSFGTLVKDGQPIIWRGPMLAKALREFLYEVEWGDLDYLIVDLPPGTGDVQLTLAQTTPMSGVIVVTTPQDVSVADVARGISMFSQLNVPILGLIENMGAFVCGHCGEVTDVFGHGGGRELVERFEIPLLGSLPLDPRVRRGGGSGVPLMASTTGSSALHDAMVVIARRVAAETSKSNLGAVPMPEMPGPRPATV